MRLRRARLRSGSEEGAAAVEFALVVPLLLTLLFGIIEFGFAYNAQILVTNAAREAAREVAVNDSATQSSVDAVAEAAVAAVDSQFTGFTVTVSPALDGSTTTPACTPGSRITVTAAAQRPLLSGFLPLEPFSLTGKATRLCAG